MKANDCFEQTARPLEQKLYAYHFENGTAGDVLTELACFQNADGGFGHGLEPDVRLPDSSIIATTVAFQRLREIGAPADHPVIVNGCRYLMDTYDAKHLNWSIIPPSIDEAPHAPWWNYDGELMNRLANPRAEILGYLYDYPDHFPGVMRADLTKSVVDYLMTHPDDMEMHDLLCYVRLWETKNLPHETKTALFEKLKRIISHVVVRDPDQWRAYGLPPLTLIQSPESPFAEMFSEEIPQNLDFLMQSQSEDGCWYPNWSWGEDAAEAWQEARREWGGVLTLSNLRVFRAFNR